MLNFIKAKYKRDKVSMQPMKIGWKDVAFNSGKMQGRCASSLEKDPVGPGSYITLNEREINENIVPFNSTTKRGLSTNEKPKNDFEKKKELIGPGRYDYNECFSWIKKSFNVKYI